MLLPGNYNNVDHRTRLQDYAIEMEHLANELGLEVLYVHINLPKSKIKLNFHRSGQLTLAASWSHKSKKWIYQHLGLTIAGDLPTALIKMQQKKEIYCSQIFTPKPLRIN